MKSSALPYTPPSPEQRAAAEYAKMPPDTVVPMFIGGVWKDWTAKELVAHHLKLHEARGG